MPKEVVYSSEVFRGDEPDKASMAEVRWSRESESLQIATVVVDAATHDPVTEEVRGGWYISLDRRTVNDLIRHLRRARDQAFGRDE